MIAWPARVRATDEVTAIVRVQPSAVVRLRFDPLIEVIVMSPKPPRPPNRPRSSPGSDSSSVGSSAAKGAGATAPPPVDGVPPDDDGAGEAAS